MLTVNTILHPTDFSHSSEAAFRLACSLARSYGARLIVLHVYPRPVTLEEVAERRLMGDPENALMTKLYELKPAEREIEVEYRLVEGNAADVIPDVADREQCDLVVMGTHGRSGFRRAVMGSVAEAVTRKARCPVATVRPSTPIPAEPAVATEPGTNPDIDLGVGDPAREVAIPVGPVTLGGTLWWPLHPRGVIIFAHGLGGTRYNPGNRAVAAHLTGAGFATLMMDLLPGPQGGRQGQEPHGALMADRLAAAAEWATRQPETVGVPVGLFGSNTGGAAALLAAARHPELVSAVVCRGRRSLLTDEDLRSVRTPALLVASTADGSAQSWDENALEQLTCPKDLLL
jgi:nucleotide-binding universal stress UspA family protein/dienelactone hydrolase